MQIRSTDSRQPTRHLYSSLPKSASWQIALADPNAVSAAAAAAPLQLPFWAASSAELPADVVAAAAQARRQLAGFLQCKTLALSNGQRRPFAEYSKQCHMSFYTSRAARRGHYHQMRAASGSLKTSVQQMQRRKRPRQTVAAHCLGILRAPGCCVRHHAAAVHFLFCRASPGPAQMAVATYHGRGKGALL